jgi:hypothetical protein
VLPRLKYLRILEVLYYEMGPRLGAVEEVELDTVTRLHAVCPSLTTVQAQSMNGVEFKLYEWDRDLRDWSFSLQGRDLWLQLTQTYGFFSLIVREQLLTTFRRILFCRPNAS